MGRRGAQGRPVDGRDPGEGETLVRRVRSVLSGDASVGEGRLAGVLAAAVPLDAARAKTLQGITKGQAAFVANVAKRGEPPVLELSASTEGFRGNVLVPALAAQAGAVDTLFAQGSPVGPLDVALAGDRRIVGAVPLKSASGETLGAFVVSRSREEETAAFRRIRDTLLGVGALALLVALPVSFALGRRIARPLEELASGAAAIREGNLDVALPEARRRRGGGARARVLRDGGRAQGEGRARADGRRASGATSTRRAATRSPRASRRRTRPPARSRARASELSSRRGTRSSPCSAAEEWARSTARWTASWTTRWR